MREEMLLELILEGDEKRDKWLRKVRSLLTPPRVLTEACFGWQFAGKAVPLFPGCNCLLPCRQISFD